MSVSLRSITGPLRARAARTDTRRQMVTVAAFVALLLLITALPYVYASFGAPRGRVFQGILFNIPDTTRYWSWMRDYRSSLLVDNRMTSEPNTPAWFSIVWLALGLLQALTDWSSATMYQLLRLGGGAAFLVILWWFYTLLTNSIVERWLAYGVANLGGGLGWIWVLDKYLNGLDNPRFAQDIYLAQPNTFFALLALPHVLVATTLLLGCFGLFLQAERQGNNLRLYGWSGVCALVLGLHHAPELIILYSVLLGYVFVICIRAHHVLWGRIRGLALVVALSLPLVVTGMVLTAGGPILDRVSGVRMGLEAAGQLNLPVLLGLPLLIVVGYAVVQLSRRSQPTRHAPRFPGVNTRLPATFLWVWTVVGFMIFAVPSNLQTTLLNGYQVPLALLAARAILGLGSRVAPRFARWLPALFVLATLPTNVYLLGWRMLDMHRANAPYFLSRGDVAALTWLNDRSLEKAVVLSSQDVGQFVPALTGHRTVLGHRRQTLHFFEKQSAVQHFFDADTSTNERHDLLRTYDVRYIIYGPEERVLGTFQPSADPTLKPVFTAPEVVVYQFIDH